MSDHSDAPLTLFGSAPIPVADTQHLAALIKALANPARLQLLSLICATGEATQIDLWRAVGRLRQPTICHHLSVLCAARVITRRYTSTWVLYRAEPETVEIVAAALRPPPGRRRRRPAA